MTNEDLILFFKTVSFRRDNDGFYVGQGQNNRDNPPFKIAIFEQNIACFKDDEILFQVPYGINLGTFLVLSQEFGIIDGRFIYESVENIEYEFYELEECIEPFFDIEEEKNKQILQVQNSKFLELLKKGKKKMK